MENKSLRQRFQDYFTTDPFIDSGAFVNWSINNLKEGESFEVCKLSLESSILTVVNHWLKRENYNMLVGIGEYYEQGMSLLSLLRYDCARLFVLSAKSSNNYDLVNNLYKHPQVKKAYDDLAIKLYQVTEQWLRDNPENLNGMIRNII